MGSAGGSALVDPKEEDNGSIDMSGRPEAWGSANGSAHPNDPPAGNMPEVPRSGPLAALDGARVLLEKAWLVDQVKDIRDKAEALRLYSRQAGLGLEMQNRCAELKLRAERRAGELLAAMPKRSNQHGAGTTLVQAGIDRHQSSRWQTIATVSENDFETFITGTAAAGRELTSAGALKLAKRAAAADKPAASHLRVITDNAPVTFTTIVTDPPWRYDNVATRGAAEDHYPTMTLEELAALDVPAAEDAHLYLWVTNGFLRPAFDLLDAWAFTYKTCLTWCKPQIGMGNWFRNNTEHVLFAVKGRLPTQRNDVGTWFVADRTRHSAKPESFYDLVEGCSPGPYLEMFARRRRFGWHVWGNEA